MTTKTGMAAVVFFDARVCHYDLDLWDDRTQCDEKRPPESAFSNQSFREFAS